LLALAALVVVLFSDVALGGRVFFERDIHLVWHGQAEAFARVVGAGSWPTWNPYHSFGQPLLANPNTQVLYPLTWLNLAMRPESYYSVYVLVHFLLTAAGFYILSRRLDLSRLASFVAAAVWVLSGPMLSLVQLWNHMAGAAWLPWTLLAADTAFASGRREHALLWGLAMTAQVLVGAPETLLAGGLLAFGLGLRHVTWRSPTRAALRRVAGITLLAVCTGLAFSAAQWVPTLAAVRQTPRLSPPESERAFWSIHPLQSLEIALPLELDRLPLSPQARATMFESREAFLPSLYTGLPALALACAALAGLRRRALALLGVGVIAVLLALGRHTPAYDLGVAALPALRAFRYPAKAMIVVELAVALLAGMGLDACREGALPRRRRLVGVVLPLAVLVLACAVASLVAHGALPPGAVAGRETLGPVLAPAATRLTVAALLGAVMVALQLGVAGAGAGPRGAMAMALVTVLELLAAHRGLNLTAPRELFALRPPALDLVKVEDGSRLYVFDYALPGRSERYLGHGGGFLLAEGPPFPWRSAAAMRTYLHPLTLACFGIEGSYVADTILLYQPHLEALTRAVFNAEETPVEDRLLRAGAVSHVVALHTRGFEGLTLLETRPSLFREPMRVYRVSDSLPRSFVVGTVHVGDDRAALGFLGEPARDLRKEAISSEGPPLRATASFTGSSEVELWRPDRVRLRVEANAPGLVVLVDTFDRGWTVTVDGRPAVARRVNLSFRGVDVSPGRHRVEWVYRPASVLAGLLVSGAALVVAVAARFASRRR
jgi:hypothetical protein